MDCWGGDVPSVSDASDLLQPGIIVQFGRPPNRIDLVSKTSGVEFTDAWNHRIEDVLDLGEAGSVPIQIIALEHLLANKRSVGRHKDLDDIEHLEAVRKTQA